MCLLKEEEHAAISSRHKSPAHLVQPEYYHQGIFASPLVTTLDIKTFRVHQMALPVMSHYKCLLFVREIFHE